MRSTISVANFVHQDRAAAFLQAQQFGAGGAVTMELDTFIDQLYDLT